MISLDGLILLCETKRNEINLYQMIANAWQLDKRERTAISFRSDDI